MRSNTVFSIAAGFFWAAKCCFTIDCLADTGFSLTQRYNDNIRIMPTPRQGSIITNISPGLLLGYVADDNELKSQLPWNQLEYINQSYLDFPEKIASLEHSFEGKRWSANLTARYALKAAMAEYHPSDHWQAGLSGFYLISTATAANNSVATSPTFLNRDFTSITPNIQWKWTPDNNLQFSYTFMNQVYTMAHQTAEANIVQLQFNYQPQINRQVI